MTILIYINLGIFHDLYSYSVDSIEVFFPCWAWLPLAALEVSSPFSFQSNLGEAAARGVRGWVWMGDIPKLRWVCLVFV